MSEPNEQPKKERPVGTFSIERDYLSQYWRELQCVFNNVVVVRVDYNYVDNLMVFTAFSDQFDDVPEGVSAPIYEAHLTMEDGKPKFEGFVRR